MAQLNASPNAYAQQNGGPATSTYIRPQFRRQGSSCKSYLLGKHSRRVRRKIFMRSRAFSRMATGILLFKSFLSDGPGHVHNMAIVVAPPRVDYSVTKVENGEYVYPIF